MQMQPSKLGNQALLIRIENGAHQNKCRIPEFSSS